MWSGLTIYIFKSSIYFTWIRLSQEIKSIDNLIDVISANQSFNDPEGLDFDLLCSLYSELSDRSAGCIANTV